MDTTEQSINVSTVVWLALVDAINPCALAVLTMMLFAIATYNPNKREKILQAGLAFSLSVFLMYFVYGIIIIKSFQLIQAITSVRIMLYKGLGIAAMLLGVLQIKDFFFYKEGSLGSEMPMSLRPKLKKIVGKVTSPAGAFGIGAFVTLFLLPCTIGPYVILGGMLSFSEVFQVLDLLTLYNFIFISPMLAITFIVYFGVRKIGDVADWKKKNVELLHLSSGLIIFALGFSMLMGWV